MSSWSHVLLLHRWHTYIFIFQYWQYQWDYNCLKLIKGGWAAGVGEAGGTGGAEVAGARGVGEHTKGKLIGNLFTQITYLCLQITNLFQQVTNLFIHNNDNVSTDCYSVSTDYLYFLTY